MVAADVAARPSEKSVAPTDQIASSACASASMPATSAGHAGKALHETAVEDRDRREGALVEDRHLEAARLVGEDRDLRDLGARPAVVGTAITGYGAAPPC